jgi:membrane-bound metal-dependent hydrolase YbcI (DUF457 family)
MDPVTHTLVGVGLGNAFFRRRHGFAAVPILALASNLPDLDGIVMLTSGQAGVLMRRTFGHSLFLLPLWVGLLALLLKRFWPKVGWGPLLGMCALGAVVHLFFDLVNSFGVVLLWPLSGWRPELAIIFIVDLVLTGLLAAPILLCLARPMRSRLPSVSRIFLGLVAFYVALCAASRLRADQVLQGEAARLTPSPTFSYLFPEPLGPHRWRGVLRQGEVYRVYLVDSLSGRAELKRWIPTAIEDPKVQRIARSGWGRRLQTFFKAPVWSDASASAGKGLESGDREISAYDLRFLTLVLGREPVFVFRFRIAGSGKIEPEF